MSYINLRKRFIALRRKTLLPIKYFFNEASRVNAVKVRDSAEIVERIGELKSALVLATKRDRRIESQALAAQIEELEWVIYANT